MPYLFDMNHWILIIDSFGKTIKILDPIEPNKLFAGSYFVNKRLTLLLNKVCSVTQAELPIGELQVVRETVNLPLQKMFFFQVGEILKSIVKNNKIIQFVPFGDRKQHSTFFKAFFVFNVNCPINRKLF
jgi:hypothetical protein